MKHAATILQVGIKATFLFKYAPRAWHKPTVVVDLPSPRGVGVIPGRVGEWKGGTTAGLNTFGWLWTYAFEHIRLGSRMPHKQSVVLVFWHFAKRPNGRLLSASLRAPQAWQ